MTLGHATAHGYRAPYGSIPPTRRSANRTVTGSSGPSTNRTVPSYPTTASRASLDHDLRRVSGGSIEER
jgi:hypothetical protein